MGHAWNIVASAVVLVHGASPEPVGGRSIGGRLWNLRMAEFCCNQWLKWPNKSLQVTFDPLPSFAIAKTGIASNAPELRR
jgi:hypothetical protein